MATRRSRYTPRLIRDSRGAQAAKNLTSISDKASKMYDKATQAKAAKKLGVKILTKESLNESQAYRDIAKDIAKVNPDLDEQIMADVENNARLISDAYMKAYGPDGTPEDMIMFQKLDNNLTGELNDLTTMIGAMDADLEAYDLAKKEGRLIKKTNEIGEVIEDENYDLFRYGITDGTSDVLLTRDEDGKYMLKGKSRAGGDEMQGIYISDYVNDLKNNGGSFKEINPNLEVQAIEFGQSIARGLLPEFKKTMKGQSVGTQKNPLAGDEDPTNPGFDAKGQPLTFVGKKQYSIQDPTKARNTLIQYFDGNFAEGFKNLTASKSVPKEEELWEYLKNEGFISKQAPSWEKSPEGTKQQMLNDAYVDFIVESNVRPGETDVVISGSKAAPTP